MRELKCPYCGVGYEPSRCTLEVSGFQLRGLDCLRCPECGDEVFTGEQMELVQHKAREAGVWGTKLGLERTISRSGRRPVIPVPAEYEKLGFVAGTKVRIYAEENKLVLEKSE